MEIKENILIILILIASAALSLIYISNGMYKTNIIWTILVIILIICFLISLIYLISQFTNGSIGNKMQIIGDNSRFFCLGIIVIFVICVACGNMFQIDSVTTVGHVELDDAQVSIFNSGEGYIGYWVNARTGEKLEDEYQQKSPTVNQSIKLNLKNINWEGQIDDSKLKQALKTNEHDVLSQFNAIVTLYGSDGSYINKYESVPILKGQELIINNTAFDGKEASNAFNFDKQKMDNTDVKYVEVELILKNTNSSLNQPDYYSFDIVSDRYELK